MSRLFGSNLGRLGVLLVVGIPVAYAQTYSSGWSTIGPGLGVSDPGVGGVYKSSGSISHLGATGPMTGGSYTATSGFWVVLTPSCHPDLDGDGDVDGNDFLTFSTCYNGSLNPARPACPNLSADLDHDGDVDGNDFLTFSTCYNGSLNPPRASCPCSGGS